MPLRVLRNVLESAALFVGMMIVFGVLRGGLSVTEWIAGVILGTITGAFLGVLWYLYRDPDRKK